MSSPAELTKLAYSSSRKKRTVEDAFEGTCTSHPAQRLKASSSSNNRQKPQLGGQADIRNPKDFFADKICPITGNKQRKTPPDLEYTGPLKTALERGYLKKPKAAKENAKRERSSDVTRLLYVAYHKIDIKRWHKYVKASGTSNGAEDKLAFKTSVKSAGNWQNQAGAFFRKAVTNTREMFDAAAFDNATTAERREIWVYLFGESAPTITRLMLGTTASVIDVQAIFLSDDRDDKRRVQFGTYFMSMFVKGCQKMFDAISHNDDTGEIAVDTLSWYEEWRDLTSSEWWLNIHLGLWKIENLPSPKRYFSDDGNSAEEDNEE